MEAVRKMNIELPGVTRPRVLTPANKNGQKELWLLLPSDMVSM